MSEIGSNGRYLRRPPKTFDTVVGASMMFFGSSGPAFAYLDPGSATVIITAILGVFGAMTYFCRQTFYKFKRRFFGKAPTDESEQEVPRENPEADTRK